MTTEHPLERIARAWDSVQTALDEHHPFWRMFAACTGGNRADHPGDLHDDLVALGNTAGALRRYRDLFAAVGRGDLIGEREAKRAVAECETHRHLVGRVMAHVAFRALVERALSSSDLPQAVLDVAARDLAKEWTARSPKLVEPSLDRQLHPRAPTPDETADMCDERARDERRYRAAREEADELARRALRFADEIEGMFVSGREGRTRLEVLINECPGAPELAPFIVLAEAASQGEIEWEPFKRAVLRHVERLRERARAAG